MSSQTRIRTACIGCGGNMRGHIGRLLQLPEIEIVGIADPYPEGIAAAKERFPQLAEVPTFEAHEPMLAGVAPDAVVISTPHVFHAEQIFAGLAAGAHVLCEKPMTCTSAEAEAVCSAAAESGKVVMVSYQRHQMPIFRWMREEIRSGRLGAIEYLSAQQFQSWADHFRDRPEAWRLHPDQSGGGQLNDSGSHLVDILLHVTGLEPRRLSCIQQRFEFAVDINSTLNLEFTNGAHGTLAIIGGARGISTAVFEDITLIGTESGLYYRTFGRAHGDPLLEIRRKGEREAATESIELPAGQTPDEHFVEVICGRAENEAPPECGLRTIRLSEAAWQSASSGGAVIDLTSG